MLELLDSKPLIVDPRTRAAGARPTVDGTARHRAGEVVFDDVSFGYLRSEPVLDGFTLALGAG